MSFLSGTALLRPAALRSTSSLLAPVTFSPARRTIITLKDNLYYTVTATATGGRDGTISSTPKDGTGHLNLKFRVPKAMGGNHGESEHNPEQLLAADHATCFLSAIQIVATKAGKKEVGDRAVVHAIIGRTKDIPGLGLGIVLRIEGVEDQAILDAAHEFCPYSRALREGIQVDVKKA